MYPTKMQDTNGNQVLLRYHMGLGTNWENSSARIKEIEDVRAVFSAGAWATYDFTYNTDAIPHLTQITNRIGTSEGYTFSYATQTLSNPFNSQAWAANTKFLQGVTVSAVSLSYGMEYVWPWTGELMKVTMPYGGYLRWAHGDWPYTGGRKQREVTYRYQSKDGSYASEKAYQFAHEANDGTKTHHTWTAIVDPSGNSYKHWEIGTSGATQRMVTRHSTYHLPGWAEKVRVEPTWTQDAHGNLSIRSTRTIYDNGQSYAKSKFVRQTVDPFGNLTQMELFDWGNETTPRRVHNSTFLATAAYKDAYIRNRVLSASVLESGATTTMVTNGYDDYSGTCHPDFNCSLDTVPVNLRERDGSYDTSKTLRGNLSWTEQLGAGGRQWLKYNAAGGVVKTRDPRGVKSDVSNFNANYSAPQQVTTGSLTSTMGWDATLALTNASGPNGDAMTASYYLSRPTSQTSPFGAVTNYSYSDATRQSKVRTNTRWTRTTVDGFGRPVKVESGNGGTTVADGTVESVVDTAYEPCGCSPMGKMNGTTLPHALGGTQKWTTYQFDGVGRTLAANQPESSGTTQYEYEGNTVKVTDPAGKWKKYEQDALGNLITVYEPKPGGGADYITRNYYDVLNRLVEVRLERDGVTQYRYFVYNAAGKLEKVKNPENGWTKYEYDSEGKLVAKTQQAGLDANGNLYNGGPRVTYEYEPAYATSLRRLVAIHRWTNSTTEEVTQLFYDENPWVDNTWGLLSSVWYKVNGMTFKESYGYSDPGAMVAKRLQIDKAGYTSAMLAAGFGFNNEGQLTGTTFPSAYQNGVLQAGRVFTYGYDSMSRPASMVDSGTGTNWLGTVQYNYAGQVTAMAGVSYGYSTLNQLTSISIAGTSGAITYTYPGSGNNGRISSMTDSLNQAAETVSYSYDSLNRLSNANVVGGAWSASYGYDGFGNLLSTTGNGSPSLSQAVDPNTNRIVGQTYDANGNQTSLGATGVYDVENRLESVGLTVKYGYDAGNKRVYKWAGSSEEVTLYGVDGRRMATYTLTTAGSALRLTRQAEWYNLGGRTIKRWDASGGESAVYTDRLGSVVYEVNSLGQSKRMKYFPYGEEMTSTGNNGDKFGTYYRDSETGGTLDYADQRYYASAKGRFQSVDAVMPEAISLAPQNWNRYSYAGGDPANFHDPSGELLAAPGSASGCMNVLMAGGTTWDELVCREGGGGGGGGGGFGGGWNPCGVSSLVPVSYCAVIPIFGQQPPPRRRAPTIECQIEVRYSEISLPGVGPTGYNHALILINRRVAGQSIGSTSLDAGGMFALIASPVQSLALILDVTIDDTGQGRYRNAAAASQSVYFSSGFSSDICLDSVLMRGAANSLNHGYLYLGPGGSNSNTFVSTLLELVGILLPPPPQSPGWGGTFAPLPPGTVIPFGPRI